METIKSMRIHALFANVTNFILGLFEALLALRVIFRLLGANPTSPFVSWLYDTTGVLLNPFRNIFASPRIEPGAVLDITALVAMILYALAASLILYFFQVIFEGTQHQHQRGHHHAV